MAQGYTPGLRITERAVIRRRRHLPLPGKLHVQVGQQVSADTLVASTELPGNVFNVNVANELACQPEEVAALLTVSEADPVQAGQVIGESRAFWGIFHSIAVSPVSGTVETISHITGQVLVRGEPIQVRVDAYLDGTVVEVQGGQEVTVEARGALLQGILGVGGEAHGQLSLRVSGPDQWLTEDDVDQSCAGKVLVGGSLVTPGALQAAVDVGAAGVVVGGINDRDLDAFLGYPLGVAITGQESLGTTLVLTEGFGEMPMARRTFEILRGREGQRASIDGTTQIRAGVIRPEVIVPEPDATWEATAEAAAVGLEVGGEVRVIREPWFGALATVAELPEQLQEIQTEAQVRVVRVRLAESGEEITVPRANVEVIQQ